VTGLSRRGVLGGLCSCSALGLLGCSTTDRPMSPSYKPDMASDEAGLWEMMDKAESEVRESRSLIRDKDLNLYVESVVCRLARDYCTDIRTYIIRTPLFNASAAPNGMLEVWSGALLRLQNEAQLAAILGHEMGHYLKRHSLEKLRNARALSGFGAFLALGLAGAGVGIAAAPADLALMASLYGFSRDQEREADAIGVTLMTKAGYRPLEAARVWEQIVAEDKADKDHKEPDFFFATHPASEERAATLRKQAEQGPDTGELGTAEYRTHISGIRTMLLEDELHLRQYDRTLVVLKALVATNGEDATIAFYTGEVFRLRDAPGDRQSAHAAYQRALDAGGAPPELYRSLGLLQRKEGARGDAEISFQKYLALRPDASDREMIRSYLGS
jgi:predicted Zn-dependent protease